MLLSRLSRVSISTLHVGECQARWLWQSHSIQKDAIPSILQRGFGKSAAYLLPILSKLMGKAKKLAAPRPNPATFQPGMEVKAEPLVLIVAPTRELAVQIFNEARWLCYRSMFRPCVMYGGVDWWFSLGGFGIQYSGKPSSRQLQSINLHPTKKKKKKKNTSREPCCTLRW
jgi:hypothetical protein